MAIKSDRQRRYLGATGRLPKKKGVRPRGRLVVHKQQKTYWLKNTEGEFEGRDDDAKHPKGTWGRKDRTGARQDNRGYIFGRKGE